MVQMGRKLCSVLMLIMLFMMACKKQSSQEEVTPDPNLVEYYPDGTPKFLKDVKVLGSEKIRIDTISKNISITLPQNFTADEISIMLTLYGGIKLLDSTMSQTAETSIRFAYKGSTPLKFALEEPKGTKAYYNVYIQVPGPSRIELQNKDIQVNSGPINIPLKIISGLGTIPSVPGEAFPTVKISDPISGLVVNGSFYGNQIYANIDAGKLIAATSTVIEINFGNGNKVNFEGVRFRLGLPRATLGGIAKVLLLRTDTIAAQGGFYRAGELYQARFSSDFLSQPASLNMRFLDSLRLSTTLPSGIPDGSYLLTFYENDKAIGKTSVYLSANTTKAIETIWQGEPTLALTRNTERLSFRKGDPFYAKPWPLTYISGTASASAFNEKDLPLLRLKASNNVTDLKPQVTVVNWAVAGFSFAVGRYIIPSTTQTGSYEASLVFPDGVESKPYWSKIEVR